MIKNGTLSSKTGAPKLLKAFVIVTDLIMNLYPLIEAHMPGMYNKCVSVLLYGSLILSSFY